MNYAVVTLSKYPALANNLIQSIVKHHKEPPDVVVICDNHDGSEIVHPSEGSVTCIPVYTPKFNFSANANIGIRSILPRDCVLVNDDTEITQPEFFNRLAKWGDSYPNFGIISPLIDGGVGSPWQSSHHPWGSRIEYKEIRGRVAVAGSLCFVCVFLRYRMLTEIGLFDERFTAYGFEDDDLCIRARRKDWRTIIVRDCVIKHGAGGAQNVRGKNWSLSFSKVPNLESNLEIFRQKYHC